MRMVGALQAKFVEEMVMQPLPDGTTMVRF